ncbi:MAG: hypothetical protein Ct9H90mP14_4000 [Methanobacteriota archaeon]|nr:MAG: hypothetical protein Ct9H90mP14_4000 [Euryarchaeota archaeon]
MAWTGVDAISVARNIIGPKPNLGAKRHQEPFVETSQWILGSQHNPGSDGEDTAAFELGLWFPDGSLSGLVMPRAKFTSDTTT